MSSVQKTPFNEREYVKERGGTVLNGGRGTARGLMRGACQRHMPLYNILHYSTHYTLLQATDSNELKQFYLYLNGENFNKNNIQIHYWYVLHFNRP